MRVSMGASLRLNTVAPPDEAKRPAPVLPGDVGFWTFIAADAMLFLLLFLQFSLDRTTQHAVFDEGQRALLPSLAAANTLILVTSSFTVALAVAATFRGDTRRIVRLMVVTSTLGVAFAILKIVEYVLEIGSGHTLSTNAFFMYYFLITGIHLLHLLVGVIGLSVIAFRLRVGGAADRNQVVLECGASYWHLIDVLWMFIFPLLYLAR